MAFADDKRGVVAGAEGTLLVTSDGGASWQAKPQSETRNLLGAYTSAPDQFWVVGWNGTILHSSDAGRDVERTARQYIESPLRDLVY